MFLHWDWDTPHPHCHDQLGPGAVALPAWRTSWPRMRHCRASLPVGASQWQCGANPRDVLKAEGMGCENVSMNFVSKNRCQFSWLSQSRGSKLITSLVCQTFAHWFLVWTRLPNILLSLVELLVNVVHVVHAAAPLLYASLGGLDPCSLWH